MAAFEYGILPYYADDFLVYLESILGKSKNTISEYYYDLLMFFRFMKVKSGNAPKDKDFTEIEVSDYTIESLAAVRLSDLYAFLNYMNNERNDQPATRARKVACLRSFFKYIWGKARLIPENPAAELESPKITKKLPKYLELDESIALLESIDGDHKERDYCMVTFFLNCGMRLSELVGINIGDIKGDTLRVLGKGNKERTIYLNDACLDALKRYLAVRPDYEEANGAKPLFLSKRKQRISPKTVQYTVKKYIRMADLDPAKYSTHKLRHTAATLMYTMGDVDIRSLQEILGHESVATTEIYTHINNTHLKDAVSKNPLANFRAAQSSDEEKKDDN